MLALSGSLTLAATLAAAASAAPTPMIAYPPFGLDEASGLAVSAAHPGVLWVIEDSGAAIVRAYDDTGAEVAAVTLDGWDNRDTEAVAIGPGPSLWVGDIGDNLAHRNGGVVVHEVPEPTQLGESTATPTSYRLVYADGPRDAETLLVDPVDGRMYIATKGLVGGLFAAPAKLTAGAVNGGQNDPTNTLTLVQSVPALITDGAFSADGSRVVLRSTALNIGSTAYVYDVERGDSGDPIRLADDPVEVALPAEAQGESIGFTVDGTALLAGSEGDDEPIWSVPLPADATPSATAVPTPTSTATRPDTETSDGPWYEHLGGWPVAMGVGVGVFVVGTLVSERRRLRR